MAVKLLLVFSFALVAVSSAGILETLLSWDLHEAEGRSSTPQSKCLCQMSGCLCCVDLNLTSGIDLGGPACVNIKQKEGNVTLNLSYGDNPVHNATIKIADAVNRPTCMNLLSEFAQLCAKFTVVVHNEHSGYDGCLVIEPALMHSPQATYNVGCFNFHEGVRKTLIPPTEVIAPATTEITHADEEDVDVDMNTDELIAAVSASAEQGFALFSRWLGLNLSPRFNGTNNKNTTPDLASRQDNSSYMSRSGRSMLELQGVPEEKSDERLKRLLSAQDNILTESAKIGYSEGARTTFVYAQQPTDLQKVNLTSIVSRESRRGGRAYNIHQHVNEV